MTELEQISTGETVTLPKRETFIERMIERSARNKFLVFIFTIFAVAAGFYGLMHTPLDAIPDLSDVQVIVYTEWEDAPRI
jgi:Cu(I)/Ag(I) efflux system membrane protein CusA/SilA